VGPTVEQQGIMPSRMRFYGLDVAYSDAMADELAA